MGENIELIEVGKLSSLDALQYLKNTDSLNETSHIGRIEFFSSDDFDSFKENAKLLSFNI